MDHILIVNKVGIFHLIGDRGYAIDLTRLTWLRADYAAHGTKLHEVPMEANQFDELVASGK